MYWGKRYNGLKNVLKFSMHISQNYTINIKLGTLQNNLLAYGTVNYYN